MTISNTELRNSAAHILKCVHLIADVSVRKDMIAMAEGVMRLTAPCSESPSHTELRERALNAHGNKDGLLILLENIDVVATILRLLDEYAELERTAISEQLWEITTRENRQLRTENEQGVSINEDLMHQIEMTDAAYKDLTAENARLLKRIEAGDEALRFIEALCQCGEPDCGSTKARAALAADDAMSSKET